MRDIVLEFDSRRMSSISRVLSDCVDRSCSCMVFFFLSAILSVVALFINIRVLISSMRKRFTSKVDSGNGIQVSPIQANIGDVAPSMNVVDELKDQLEANKFSRWQHYCSGLLAAF